MKTKLSLIALALIATVGVASAQNKTKEVKSEPAKSCCTEKKQTVSTTKEDPKTCKCEGVKDAKGNVVKKQECKSVAKDQKCTGKCDGCSKSADKKETGCCPKATEKKEATCCPDAAKKVEKKEAEKKSECTGNCSECTNHK